VRALIFGSSIAEGYWASQGGWVQRLINDVARYHVENSQGAAEGDWVMNLGVGGDTVGSYPTLNDFDPNSPNCTNWPAS
jgi:hypothetical protein